LMRRTGRSLMACAFCGELLRGKELAPPGRVAWRCAVGRPEMGDGRELWRPAADYHGLRLPARCWLRRGEVVCAEVS